jgi:hypothetical protein
MTERGVSVEDLVERAASLAAEAKTPVYVAVDGARGTRGNRG